MGLIVDALALAFWGYGAPSLRKHLLKHHQHPYRAASNRFDCTWRPTWLRPNGREHQFLEAVVTTSPDLLPAVVYADDKVVSLVKRARRLRKLAWISILGWLLATVLSAN